MTPAPLSPEARVELVEKAKAATPGPWRLRTNRHETKDGYPWGWVSENTDANIALPNMRITWERPQGRANAAFIAAANPSTILAYEATVQALTEERDAALERVKALEADKKHLRDTLMGARDVCLNGLALLTPKDPDQ